MSAKYARVSGKGCCHWEWYKWELGEKYEFYVTIKNTFLGGLR